MDGARGGGFGAGTTGLRMRIAPRVLGIRQGDALEALSTGALRAVMPCEAHIACLTAVPALKRPLDEACRRVWFAVRCAWRDAVIEANGQVSVRRWNLAVMMRGYDGSSRPQEVGRGIASKATIRAVFGSFYRITYLIKGAL